MAGSVKDTHTKTTRARLFLEGIEIPLISVMVTGGRGASATASVEVIPSDHVHQLKPRTLVHIFFYDPDFRTKTAGGFGSFTAKDSDQKIVDADTDASDTNRWKLLFCGEVMAYSYVKSNNARVIQLMCQDLSSYWDACPLYFGKFKTTDRRYKQHIHMGASSITVGRDNVDSSSEVIRILQGRPSTYANSLTGVAGGVINLMESICGVYNRHGTSSKKSQPNSLGINDFLTQAEMRLRISRMVGASPFDTTSTKFLGYKTKDGNVRFFRRMLRRLFRAQSALVSYTHLMQIVLQQVHYTMTTVVAPAFFPFDEDDHRLKFQMQYLKPVTGSRAGKDHAKVTELGDRIDAALAHTDKRVARWQVGGELANETTSGAHGTEIMPAQALGSADAARFFATKEALAGGHKGEAALRGDGERQATYTNNCRDAITGNPRGNVLSVTRDAHDEIIRLATGYLPAATAQGPSVLDADYTASSKQHIISASNGLRKAGIIIDGWDIVADVWDTDAKAYVRLDGAGDQDVAGGIAKSRGYAGDWSDPRQTSDSVENVQKLLKAAKADIDKARKKRRRYTREEKMVSLRDRLTCFLILPDIYMCPPPTCNVLFPEDYNSISFSRHFMSEATRLWLHGINDHGKPERKMYFAPNGDILGGSDLSAGKAASRAKNFLMTHEKFSGQIPSMEGIADLDLLTEINKKMDKDSRKALGSDPHMKRTANYLFFKKRFGSRTAQVSGRFNPYLVPGLPGLVLDPDTASIADIGETPTHTFIMTDAPPMEELKERRTASGVPTVGGTHYYGIIEKVTHSISQEGAVTHMVMSHCRTHSEGLEMFGDAKDITEDGEVSIFSKATRNRVPNPSKSRRHRDYEASGKFLFSLGRPKAGVMTPDTPLYKVMWTSGGRGKWVIKQAAARRHIKSTYGVKFKPGRIYHVSPASVGDPPDDKATFYEADGLTRVTDASATANGHHMEVIVIMTEIDPSNRIKGTAIPFETICRPPWFSSAFFNENIGEQVYRQLIGCGSVVDATILNPNLLRADVVASAKKSPVGSKDLYLTHAATMARTLFKKDPGVWPAGSFDVAAGKAVPGFTHWKADLSLGDPISTPMSNYESSLFDKEQNYSWETDPLFGAYSQGINSREGAAEVFDVGIRIPNIAIDSKNCFKAAEDLAHMYAVLVNTGVADVDSFITNYRGDRLFADMEDIFGLQNDYVLELSEGGTGRVLHGFNPKKALTRSTFSPKELGYHHYAFGEYENLEKLSNEPLLPKGESARTGKRKVHGSVDPRKTRYLLVKNYVSDILSKRVRKT